MTKRIQIITADLRNLVAVVIFTTKGTKNTKGEVKGRLLLLSK